MHSPPCSAWQLQEGGAIFQERWATFVFNGPASFVNNKAWNVSILPGH